MCRHSLRRVRRTGGVCVLLVTLGVCGTWGEEAKQSWRERLLNAAGAGWAEAVRYVQQNPAEAKAILEPELESDNTLRHSRALGLLARLPDGSNYVIRAMQSTNEVVRLGGTMVGIRTCLELPEVGLGCVARLTETKDPEVRYSIISTLAEYSRRPFAPVVRKLLDPILEQAARAGEPERCANDAVLLLSRQQDETSVLFLRELARQQQATIDRKLRYVDFRGHLVVALAVTGDQGSVRDIAAAMQDRKCHPALRKHLLLLVASNLCGQPELMRALYKASEMLPDYDSWVAQGKCIDHLGENLACDEYHLVVSATGTLAHCFKIPFDSPATRYPTAEELSRVRSAAAVRLGIKTP